MKKDEGGMSLIRRPRKKLRSFGVGGRKLSARNAGDARNFHRRSDAGAWQLSRKKYAGALQ